MERSNRVISSLMKWQICLPLLVLLTSYSAQSAYIFVTPTPDTLCPDPCYTLSGYAELHFFKNLPMNTTVKFLPGNHTLNQTISVIDLKHLTLHGDPSSLPKITSTIVCTWPAGFVFTGITELHISSLAFISCGHNDGAAVNIISVQQSNISNCSFHSNVNADSYANDPKYIYNYVGRPRYVHNGGALYIQSSCVILTTNKFQHNSAAKGGAVYMDTSNSIITGNTFECDSADLSGGTLYVQSSTLHLTRSTFQNNSAKYGGALCVNASTINLTRNVFQNNSADRSGGALYAVSSTLKFTYTTFQSNAANIWGGALCVELFSNLSFTVSKFQNNTADRGGALTAVISALNLTRSTFQNNLAGENGGAFYIESSTLNLTGNTFQNNLARWKGGTFYVESGTLNINLTKITAPWGVFDVQTSTLYLTKNTFQNNSARWGGALNVESMTSTLTLTRNTFQNNSAESDGGVLYMNTSRSTTTENTFKYNLADGSGGALYVRLGTLNLTRNTFQNNSAKSEGGVLYMNTSRSTTTENTFKYNSADGSGGAFYVRLGTLKLTNSLFQSNSAKAWGGALHVESSTLNLTRNIFQNNSAGSDGGVLYMNTSRSIITENTYKYNSADGSGGALYVVSSTLSLTRNIFKTNIADLCGGALYALSSIFNQLTKNTFQNNSADYGEVLEIFSDLLHLCTCRNNLTDCTGAYSPEPVYPGGTLEVPVIAYGQWNGATAAVLAVSNRPNSDITINNHENSRNVINYNTCSSLKYIIHSHAVGTTQEITLYIAKSHCPLNDTHSKTLTVTAYILSCPPGFQLSKTQPDCICAARLQQFTNTCLIDYTTVLRAQDAEFWVGYDKKSQGLILHPHCPFDYCTSEETYVAVDDSDKQCNYNRSGLLCGRCSDNLSLVLGSSRCLQCSNSYLSLLAAFAFAGIALVLLLLVLKLTVAAGTINGLILYANVVAVNSAIFFQPQTTDVPKMMVHTAKVLTAFVAWLNLDLGIETCFYNGMNTYVKTWLQFVFPLYVWVLVGIIIIGSYYSGRISRLFGSNPIAVLATLFLLSYAKLLRAVFVALSYTYLEYPNNSQIAVWLYDGNIRYFSGKHIPLFIAAMVCLIFLFLPYTIVLIFSQWLHAKSELKIFSCINSHYVRPFLDAYHAPYSNEHRYWTGLMLLLRFVLFLIFAVNTLGDPSVNLLAIASTTVAILTLLAIHNTKIYKMRSLGLLEISFILNLTILAVATLYIRLTRGNQNAATFMSVGIAFATFTGIVIYHSVQQLKGTRLWRRMSLRLNSMMTNVDSGPEDRPGSPLNLVFISGSAPTQTVVCIRNSELREPLLTSN